MSVSRDLIKICFSGLGQLLSLVIPLLLYPFIIKKFGIAEFGLLMTYLSLMPVFNQIGDMGVNTVGAIFMTEDKTADRVSEVYSAKFITSCIGMVLFFVFCISLSKYRENMALVYSTGFLIFLTCLIPNFFFVSFKKYHLVPMTPALHKSLFVLGVYAFASNLSDITAVNFINLISMLIVSGLTLWYIRYYLKGLSFKRATNFLTSKRQDLKQVFTANTLISVYVAFPILLLNYIETKEVVGFYSYAEKLMLGGKAFISVFSGIIFSKLANRDKFESVYKAFYLPFVALVFFGCLVVSIKSEFVLNIFSGPADSAEYLSWLIWALFPIAVNTIFYQSILARKAYVNARNLILIATFLSILVIGILGVKQGTLGVIYGIIASELIYLLLAFKGFKRINNGK